jgi:hypothetical protein
MLSNLLDKDPDQIIVAMTEEYFQLDKYLSDDHMKTNFDWLQMFTDLIERILPCLGQEKRIADILVRTLYFFFQTNHLILFRLSYPIQFIFKLYMKKYVKRIQKRIHYALILFLKH